MKLGCLVLISFLVGLQTTIADTWTSPKPFSVYSSKSNFVARVEPGSFEPTKQKPVLTVFTVATGVQVQRWKVELANLFSPVTVLISDDGQYVVTLDNHSSVGNGDTVLAFYTKQGLIKKRSLEEVLAEVQPQVNESDYRNLFSHSVSSRWWRERSVTLFDGSGANIRFGIWLDWTAQWLGWRLSDGSAVKLSPEESRIWMSRGGSWARAALAEPEVPGRPAKEEMRQWTATAMEWSRREGARFHNQITACRYLAYSKSSGDLELLERLLHNTEENQNFELELRVNADRALAISAGAATNFPFRAEPEQAPYFRLGKLDLTVELPSAPDSRGGQLYVSIFPEMVRESSWRLASATFRTGVSFRSTSVARASEVPVKTMPLPPGRYWVKAVWDRSQPFQHDLYSYEGMREWKKSGEPAPSAEFGDFESGPPQMFDLGPGKTVQLHVKCIQPGKPTVDKRSPAE